MTRYAFAACLVAIVAVAASQSQTSAADDPVTFSKDVLPILQKNCQSCHRPGQMAPMALVTWTGLVNCGTGSARPRNS